MRQQLVPARLGGSGMREYSEGIHIRAQSVSRRAWQPNVISFGQLSTNAILEVMLPKRVVASALGQSLRAVKLLLHFHVRGPLSHAIWDIPNSVSACGKGSPLIRNKSCTDFVFSETIPHQA